MRLALTIAGSDPGGGAGIQADLKTFAAHGVYGTSAVTAITVQNSLGVDAVVPLDAQLVSAQIAAVLSDFGTDAAKTGMLGTAAIVAAVAAAMRDGQVPNLVVDPVLVASSGARLLDEDALDTLRNHLLPCARVVTPNVPEAEVLAGIPIHDEADVAAAARRILDFGVEAVVITGGHLASDPVVDRLFTGSSSETFAVPRLRGPHTHGTGCTFSAAVAAQLARGASLGDAVGLAQEYVAGAIRHAPGLGQGRGPLGHFWRG